ncbi:MAG: hypothetical protein EOO93_23235, partial [Pedobacter sp.]
MFTYFVDSNHDIRGNENLKPENSYSGTLFYTLTSKPEKTLKWSVDASSMYLQVQDRIEMALINDAPLQYEYINVKTDQNWLNTISGRISNKNVGLNVGFSILGRALEINDLSDTKYRYSSEMNSSIYYNLLKTKTSFSLFFKAFGKTNRIVEDKTLGVTQYILAEQNALSSLANAPISNYSALFILATTNMAKHEFSEAKKLASQMTDDPNMKLQALGIIFDANYAIGDLKACEKNLAEIEQSKKEIFKYKLPGVDPKDVNDMINTNRYALLSYSQGKVQESEKYFLKAIKESINIYGEPKAWIYNLYATFLTKNGRLEDAKDNIQYALNEVPNYTSALVQKSEIAYQEKNWQEIITNLKPINDKVPRSDIILRLAKAEKKLNNIESYNQLISQAESLLKEEVSVGGFGHRRDYIQLLIEKNTPESLKEALTKAE